MFVKLLHEKGVRVFLANPVRGTQPGGREPWRRLHKLIGRGDA
ncbi:MAG: hypothetical protein ACXQTZ_02905 [Candidatus Alkanophagales archaeon]